MTIGAKKEVHHFFTKITMTSFVLSFYVVVSDWTNKKL
jgi:hypothetical protein